MIYIDGRVGSKDLAAPLQKRGLPVELTKLEYGDVSFIGNGPAGLQPIGIEIKTVGDLLSCIADKRFAGHQLPGLQETYSVIYLLVEGIYRAGDDGELLVNGRPVSWGKRTWTYAQVDGFLTTQVEQGGVKLLRTAARSETVAAVHSKYSWWTAKDWEEHDSSRAIHNVPVRMLARPQTAEGWKRLRRIKVAMQFDGLGQEKAEAAADHFKSIRAMVNADEAQWQEVDGIGKTIADRVVRAVS